MRSVFVIIASLFLGGCGTAEMWSSALNDDKLRFKGIPGSIVDQVGAGASTARIIVGYARSGEKPTRFVVIPVVDGEVPEPFRLTSDASSGPTDSELVRMADRSCRELDRATREKRVVELSRSEGVSAAPYYAARVDSGYSNWSVTLGGAARRNGDSTVLLRIPNTMPRPAVDHAGQLVLTAVVTPATLVIDVVSFPFGVVMTAAFAADGAY